MPAEVVYFLKNYYFPFVKAFLFPPTVKFLTVLLNIVFKSVRQYRIFIQRFGISSH